MSGTEKVEQLSPHETHVLTLCVLRHYFLQSDSAGVVFEEDGRTVDEARGMGLRPILACRLRVDGVAIQRTILADLDSRFDLGAFLERSWKEEHEMCGVPPVLVGDEWIGEQYPELVAGVTALGCRFSAEAGNKKVSGTKGALQRQRFHHLMKRPYTLAGMNASSKFHEDIATDQFNVSAAGCRYSCEVVARPWPATGSMPCVLIGETEELLAGTPKKPRPIRDIEADVKIEQALRLLGHSARYQHDDESLATMKQGAELLAEAIKEPLEAWRQWFEWDKKAYLYVGTETGSGLARIRIGAPSDHLAAVFGRAERLPERWPRMNSWTCKVEGMCLELQTWKLGQAVELRVAVGFEGYGLNALRDAISSPDAGDLKKLIRRGRFRLEWPESETRQTSGNAWDQVNLALAGGVEGLSELAFERRFQDCARADEVVAAMFDALRLIDEFARCWSDAVAARSSGGSA